jgi:hypothetical protein
LPALDSAARLPSARTIVGSISGSGTRRIGRA